MLVYFIKGTMDELRDEVQTSHSTIQMTTKTGRHTLNIVENTSGWSTANRMVIIHKPSETYGNF